LRRKLLVSLTLVVAIVLTVALLVFQTIQPAGMIMHGSLFVSDAGRSHGGFEYNAEWNATLTMKGRAGVLRLVLHIGIGDALEKHDYTVTDFVKDSSKISMKIEGQLVVLIWQETETVWNHAYDRYYVASWGSDSPLEEIRGTISPLIFPGLVEHYYVELRLR